jgi:hypothetical protein
MIITLIYRYMDNPPLEKHLYYPSLRLYPLSNIPVFYSQVTIKTCRGLGTILAPMLEVKGNHFFYMV